MFPFCRQENGGLEREDDLAEIALLVQGAPGPSPALHPHRALLPHITYSPTAACDSPCQPRGSHCTCSVHAHGICGIPESKCSP